MILITLYLQRCFKPHAERKALVLHEKSNGQFGTKLFDGHGIQLVLLCTKRGNVEFFVWRKGLLKSDVLRKTSIFQKSTQIQRAQSGPWVEDVPFSHGHGIVTTVVLACKRGNNITFVRHAKEKEDSPIIVKKRNDHQHVFGVWIC